MPEKKDPESQLLKAIHKLSQSIESNTEKLDAMYARSEVTTRLLAESTGYEVRGATPRSIKDKTLKIVKRTKSREVQKQKEDPTSKLEKPVEQLSQNIKKIDNDLKQLDSSIQDLNSVNRQSASIITRSLKGLSGVTSFAKRAGAATIGTAGSVAGSALSGFEGVDVSSDYDMFKQNLKKAGSFALGGGVVPAHIFSFASSMIKDITRRFKQSGQVEGVNSFAKGGIVPGAPGQPKRITAHGGELILPADHKNGIIDRLDTLIELQMLTNKTIEIGTNKELRQIFDVLNFGNSIVRLFSEPLSLAVEEIKEGIQKLDFSVKGMIVELPKFLVTDLIGKVIMKDVFWKMIGENLIGKVLVRGVIWEEIMQPFLTSFITDPKRRGTLGKAVGGIGAGALLGSSVGLGSAAGTGAGAGVAGVLGAGATGGVGAALTANPIIAAALAAGAIGGLVGAGAGTFAPVGGAALGGIVGSLAGGMGGPLGAVIGGLGGKAIADFHKNINSTEYESLLELKKIESHTGGTLEQLGGKRADHGFLWKMGEGISEFNKSLAAIIHLPGRISDTLGWMSSKFRSITGSGDVDLGSRSLVSDYTDTPTITKRSLIDVAIDSHSELINIKNILSEKFGISHDIMGSIEKTSKGELKVAKESKRLQILSFLKGMVPGPGMMALMGIAGAIFPIIKNFGEFGAVDGVKKTGLEAFGGLSQIGKNNKIIKVLMEKIAGKSMGKLLTKVAGRGIPLLSSIMTFTKSIKNGDRPSLALGKSIGEGLGLIVGGSIGASVGPLGAIIGGLLGSFAGEMVGELFVDWVLPPGENPEKVLLNKDRKSFLGDMATADTSVNGLMNVMGFGVPSYSPSKDNEPKMIFGKNMPEYKKSLQKFPPGVKTGDRININTGLSESESNGMIHLNDNDLQLNSESSESAPESNGMIQRAFAFISGNEGFRSEAYSDSGVMSVGYGTRATGDSINEEQAENDSKGFIRKSYEDLKKKFPGFDKYPEKLKLTLLDLSYNMGNEWTKNFPRAYRHMRAGNWIDAAKELKLNEAGTGLSKYFSEIPGRAQANIDTISEMSTSYLNNKLGKYDSINNALGKSRKEIEFRKRRSHEWARMTQKHGNIVGSYDDWINNHPNPYENKPMNVIGDRMDDAKQYTKEKYAEMMATDTAIQIKETIKQGKERTKELGTALLEAGKIGAEKTAELTANTLSTVVNTFNNSSNVSAPTISGGTQNQQTGIETMTENDLLILQGIPQ